MGEKNILSGGYQMENFENAKVRVAQGWLQGEVQGKLKIFKGIPYAAPPVGEVRGCL